MEVLIAGGRPRLNALLLPFVAGGGGATGMAGCCCGGCGGACKGGCVGCGLNVLSDAGGCGRRTPAPGLKPLATLAGGPVGVAAAGCAGCGCGGGGAACALPFWYCGCGGGTGGFVGVGVHATAGCGHADAGLCMGGMCGCGTGEAKLPPLL